MVLVIERVSVQFSFKLHWATLVARAPIRVMASNDRARVTSTSFSGESRIVDWLNDDYEPESELDWDTDEGEVDLVTEEIHNSDSEEIVEDAAANVWESDSVSTDEELNIQANSYFLAKDSFRWKKDITARNIRTRSHNIVMHLPGPKGNAKNAW